ncbi:hypothetical protein H6P81_014362 [Aristolochia fimbriata]|uniref:Uncharacterized protein n=1 Tax=Aristolochia fimbriata TaxID=158543 RepID=A0AAV7EHV0_ARIFI|nr:hypothetical protein H6P81_014362 [Aristolochia fimbriata]
MCKSNSLNESATSHMCQLGRHWPCAGLAFTSQLNALAESEVEASRGSSTAVSQAPLLKFGGHKDEGHAIDWSPVSLGKLVSGDCKSCIHLWEPSSGTWNVDTNPFKGHTASVEDLQWSPTEAYVFVSCSVDGTIAIWDTRLGKTPAISVKAHNADVNVISWNRLASCMIASGSDDGTFSIRDLRLIKDLGPVVRERRGRRNGVQGQNEGASECSRGFTTTASICSSGSKGLERVALAATDTGNAVIHLT